MKSPAHKNVCAVRHLGGCRGRLQDHHVVKRQHIRQRHRTLAAEHRRGGPKPWAYASAIGDPRLQVPVCSGPGGHHGLEATARLEIPRHELRAGFWDAVHEYGLEPWVPDHLSEEE